MTDSISNTGEPQPKRQKRLQNSCTPSQPAQSKATIYRPLDSTKREIRICDLSPAPELSDSLQCSLRVVPIDEAGKYVAFSYVWGTDAATETISVDGIIHPIRQNLAAGLRRFRARFPRRSHPRTRHQSRPISIWADALCIDQNNVEERNHQVNLMRLVFTRCDYALSWLGEADEDSDLAMDCIAKIASLGNEATRYSLLIRKLTNIWPFYEAGPWVAIQRLMNRDFWYRIWIFQELLLPGNLVVSCGSKFVPWSIFKGVFGVRVCRDSMRGDGSYIRKLITHIDSNTQDEILEVSRILDDHLAVYLSRERGGSISTMETILDFTRHLQATDPRDKIYGFLALMENCNIQPDYSKTTQQVYIQVAKLMLPETPKILVCSGISTAGNATSPAIASSWVPNWDWIARSAAKTTTLWRDFELYTYFPGHYYSLQKFEFKRLPDVEVLRFHGQICHIVINPVCYTKWLDPIYMAVTIGNMYGHSYPQWSEDYRLQEPVQKLVALCLTLVQHTGTRIEPEVLEQLAELAAGFCHIISLRTTENRNETGTSIVSEALSILLQLFEKEFGEQPQAFRHPERYSGSYLAEEKATLQQRVFFETPAGHFGAGPLGVKGGDIICKVYGCWWPVILREVDSHYVLVGTCWILGFNGDQGLDTSESEMIEVW